VAQVGQLSEPDVFRDKVLSPQACPEMGLSLHLGDDFVVAPTIVWQGTHLHRGDLLLFAGKYEVVTAFLAAAGKFFMASQRYVVVAKASGRFAMYVMVPNLNCSGLSSSNRGVRVGVFCFIVFFEFIFLGVPPAWAFLKSHQTRCACGNIVATRWSTSWASKWSRWRTLGTLSRLAPLSF